MPSPAVIIAGILAVVITMFFVAYSQKCCEVAIEPFADKCQTCSGTFNQCPFQSKSYYDKGGELRCCGGELIGNTCSDIMCSFTPNKEGIPLCSVYTKSQFEQEGSARCPRKYPNYFYNFTTMSGGCTDGALNAQLCGPLNDNQPKCLFDGSANSCDALKALEDGAAALGPGAQVIADLAQNAALREQVVTKFRNDKSFRDIFTAALQKAIAAFQGEIAAQQGSGSGPGPASTK